MPQITSLKIQKNKKRVNVYLDGKFGFGLSAEALARAKLEVGQNITEEEIKLLQDKDLEEKLYNRTLNFLSYRPRSEREIRSYLSKKLATLRTQRKGSNIFTTEDTEIIEKILEKLKKQKLLDDFKFASWWVDQRLDFKFFGPQRLRAELMTKGISREIIERVLVKIDQEKLLNLAKKLLQKKKRLYGKLDRHKLREKLIAHLKRRGFSWSIIEEAIDDFMNKD